MIVNMNVTFVLDKGRRGCRKFGIRAMEVEK